MIHEDGAAKITDFGVAKIVSQQMTVAGTMMGTPSYMSPEQMQGGEITGRTDQFSLAVMVYEVLTGEKPFTAEYLPTLLYRIVREDPVPPQRLNTTLTPQIEAVLRKALSKTRRTATKPAPISSPPWPSPAMPRPDGFRCLAARARICPPPALRKGSPRPWPTSAAGLQDGIVSCRLEHSHGSAASSSAASARIGSRSGSHRCCRRCSGAPGAEHPLPKLPDAPPPVWEPRRRL